MDDLTLLGEHVAEHLLGRQTVVRYGTRDGRYGRELKGQVYWECGVCVIDLSPDMRPEQMLHVLLHEIGHAKAHPQGLPDHARSGERPAELERRPRLEQSHPMIHEAREREAEYWAKRWGDWAKARVPGGSVEDRLWALLEWTPRATVPVQTQPRQRSEKAAASWSREPLRPLWSRLVIQETSPGSGLYHTVPRRGG